jgi:PAS domain S-box-containing protein
MSIETFEENCIVTIRAKALVATFIPFVILVIALVWSSQSLMLRSFNSLETNYVHKDVQRISRAVKNESARLLLTAADWASWDDTYTFIENRNQAYIDANISLSAFQNLHINFMLFVNSAGNLAYAQGYDLTKGGELEPSLEIKALIASSKFQRLIHAPDDINHNGILLLKDQPLLMAMRPILKNQDVGPARGVLILAKWLNQEAVITEMQQSLNLQFSLKPLFAIKGIPEYRAICNEISPRQPILTRPRNAQTIIGYTELKDIFDESVLLLEFVGARDIYQHGANAIHYFTLWVVLISAIIGATILGSLSYSIFPRLAAFSQRMEAIRQSADPSMRLVEHGADELSAMAKVINGMLAAIEHSQASLLKSEEKYRLLFDQMLNAFALHEIICDAAGQPMDYRFIEVNPAFEKSTGLQKEAIIGKTVTEVLPGLDSAWIKTYGEVALKGTSIHFEQYNPEIGKFFEIMAFSPSPGRFATIFTDITARRLAEKEKEEIQQRLVQSQKLEMLGQLAGGVAHDINNMLGSIAGFAELIKIKFAPNNPTLTKYIETILASVERMSHLATQLLSFSRKGPAQQTEVNIHDTIEKVIELIRHSIDKRITIQNHFYANSAFVRGDGSQLYNVILNLALNARDAMPKGGQILFSTESLILTEDSPWVRDKSLRPGPHLKVAVRDNGLGMDETVLAKLFEPFFTTKPVGRGTGLGLASVLRSIEQHHGKIEVQSKVGEGTTFYLYLPAVEPQKREEEAPFTVIIPKGSGNILVVDDEESIQRMASYILGELGYGVHICRDGIEALAYYTQNFAEIDLIILDLIMPNMSGYDCFLELKRINPQVKVMILSGYTIDGEAQRLLNAGALGFIQKPFKLKLIASSIYEALAKSMATESAQIIS